MFKMIILYLVLFDEEELLLASQGIFQEFFLVCSQSGNHPSKDVGEKKMAEDLTKSGYKPETK